MPMKIEVCPTCETETIEQSGLPYCTECKKYLEKVASITVYTDRELKQVQIDVLEDILFNYETMLSIEDYIRDRLDELKRGKETNDDSTVR